MTYRRETLYPCKFLVGFTEEQRAGLEEIADRDEKPISAIVRACVDQHLRTVADRRRGRRSDRRAAERAKRSK